MSFNSSYFRKRRYLAWRAPIICSAIKRVFRPTSVVDFGCSMGDLVRGFNEIGVPAIGFDISTPLFQWSEAETPIFIQDITEPLPTLSCFDLALCVEVLRFIPDEKLSGLMNNFHCHSNRVLIGYGGDKRDYIISLFKSNGFQQSEDEIPELRYQLEQWKHKPAIKALYHGALYFLC